MTNVVRFEAPWDGGLWATTVATIALVVAVTAFVIVAGARSGNPAVQAVTIVAALPGLLAVAGSWWWSPRAFVVSADGVRIERPAGAVEVPMSSIRDVQPLEDGLRFRRVFGVGGLFGHYGTFSEARLGSVRLYATRGGGRVALVTANGTVVITPDRPERFVSELRGRLQSGR